MANTNPILPAGIGDITAAEVLAGEYLRLLAERGNIMTHPAIMSITGPAGSNVVKVPHVGLEGYDILSARTPGTEVDSTALTDAHTDVTVAPYSKRYSVDDLSRHMAGGIINPTAFALDAAIAANQTALDIIANVTDGFTATVGSTGVDLTWADLIAAKATLAIAKASGAMLCILHPRQWGDLDVDALSLGGAIQHSEGLQSALVQGLGQYKGRFFGMDVFVSSRVPTANAGADRAGAVFTRGAVAFADVMYPDVPVDRGVNLGRALYEESRAGTFAQTNHMTHAIMGAAMGIDAAGVSVISDA